MPPRGRPLTKGKLSSLGPPGSHILVLGNCRLDVPDALGYEVNHEGFSTEIQDVGTLKVYEGTNRALSPPIGLSFSLLNPKNADVAGKKLLQDVLHLYNVELPAMSFAANTGMESPFLESCIMDGKYCTLIMRHNDLYSLDNELVGAVTFQILPPDTQHAEVPLAAVRHARQRKGYGTIICNELQRRLMDVGVTSIFCWGDLESKPFWSKQGFVPVAEVDSRGKPIKLPIKGDLKKAMSIPGNATLMIAYFHSGLYQTTVPVSPKSVRVTKNMSHEAPEQCSSFTPSRHPSLGNVWDAGKNGSPTTMVTTPQVTGELKSSQITPPQTTVKSQQLSSGGNFQEYSKAVIPLKMEGKLFGLDSDPSVEKIELNIPSETSQPDKVSSAPTSAPPAERLNADKNMSGLSTANMENTVPATKKAGPLKKRPYARRQQTSSTPKSDNLVQSSTLHVPSGKENIGEGQLTVDLQEEVLSDEGKLSSFLGPRSKVGQRKENGLNAENQHETSKLSAFIGPRKKVELNKPEGLSHEESARASVVIVARNLSEDNGKAFEAVLNFQGSTPLGPGLTKVGGINSTGRQLDKTSREENSVSRRAGAPGKSVGVKRGRPPKAPISKGEENAQEGTDAAKQKKDQVGPIKRGRPSNTAGEEGSLKSRAVAISSQAARSRRRMETESKSVDGSLKIDREKSETDPEEGCEALSRSGTVQPKGAIKRGRPAKLVGVRSKRMKAGHAATSGVEINLEEEEDASKAETVQKKQVNADDGLAEIVNLLLPKSNEAVNGTALHGCAGLHEGSCVPDSMDSLVQSGVQEAKAPASQRLKSIARGNSIISGGSPEPAHHLENPSDAECHTNGPATARTNADPLENSESPESASREAEASTGAVYGAGQLPQDSKYIIMFMNMADENKKKQLSKHVEKLGGLVTCEGKKCTHVVTMEVRRTLNFCVAISSGAWILSPDWLKASVKQKKFVVEEPFILRDKKFEAKYNTTLNDVIPKAKQMPNLLLDGMYIYPTPNVHPPTDTISEIIKAAGGQVITSLEEAMQLEKKSLGIVVACEEDMDQAMSAAKVGLRTFTSDWLLTCIVKQELDLSIPQFTESL